MNKMSSDELRTAWIKFYEDRGHINIGQVSLVGDGETGVLFNVAGMQSLMPYLMGKKHPKGKRLCNVQGCVRTIDIESVGDSSHVTFFEMMGSWSLGDYFKKERTQWSYELLTEVFGFEPEKIAATVFEGDNFAPRDDETAQYRIQSGIKKENIFYLPKKENWWELEKGPCGPDSEMFYITEKKACGENCNPGCDCGRYIEVGNDVFMQYEKIADNEYKTLEQKNIDTGWGLERILQFMNGTGDIYTIDLFCKAIKYVEEKSNIKYGQDEKTTKAMRIIVDHIRTAVMLIGDENKLLPSNVGAGYILRRLIRRAVRYAKILNINKNDLCNIALIYIEDVYKNAYPRLLEQKNYIVEELSKEIEKFDRTIEKGLREFEKIISKLQGNILEKDLAFKLYDTYGFPIELTEELANELGIKVDMEGFKEKFKEHQELSKKNSSSGKFKGGLAGESEAEIKYHTATHLLNAALKVVIGPNIHQKGSNITKERMRFDFSYDNKLTVEEKENVEKLVNKWIEEGLEVKKEKMSKKEAIASGAECMFIEKYPDIVTVYTIGDNISKEICGGPHVNNTNELGHFVIQQEKSSSSGVRRIKAVLVENE